MTVTAIASENWAQEDFNEWVAANDQFVTYEEAKFEAEAHNLALDEALAYATLYPGGKYV